LIIGQSYTTKHIINIWHKNDKCARPVTNKDSFYDYNF
jgi:hypothetical protein